MTAQEPLGPALVSWNDYVGTAAADECEVGAAPSLYEIAGLDPKAWTIVGVDIAVGCREVAALTVYAFDRTRHGVQSFAELLDHAQHAGELPVTAFDMSLENQADVFILFKQIAIRLITRGMQDERLVVTEVRSPLARDTLHDRPHSWR